MSVIYRINRTLLGMVMIIICCVANLYAQKATVKRWVTADDGSRQLLTYDTTLGARTSLRMTALSAQTTATTTSCTCECLRPLFDYLIASERLFTPATDNLLVSSLVVDANAAGYAVDYTSCAILKDNINKTFYAMTTETVGNTYKARIGDCVVSLSSQTSDPVVFLKLRSNECDESGTVTFQSGDILHTTLPCTESMIIYDVIHSDAIFTDPFYTTPNIGVWNYVKDAFSQKLMSGTESKSSPVGSVEQFSVRSYFNFGGIESLPANKTILSATLKLYANTNGFLSPHFPNAHSTSAEIGANPLIVCMPNDNWELSTTYPLRFFNGWVQIGPPEENQPVIGSHFEDITWNVTSYVKSWKDGNRGLVLFPNDPPLGEMAYTTFFSEKAEDASKRPVLDVTYFIPQEGAGLAQLQVEACYTCTPAASVICNSAITEMSVNPYVYSLAGNWRPSKAYTYYGPRTAPSFADKTNVRRDGTLSSYASFWAFQPDKVMSPRYDENRWVWNSESTLFNRKGFELENKDPLGRYNAGLYGYDHALPVAVVQNSRYRESAFEGFEDYFFGGVLCDEACSEKRSIDFTLYKDHLVTTEKHTGKYSLRVDAQASAGISANLVSDENNVFGLTFNTEMNSCEEGNGEQLLKSVSANSDALLPGFSPLSNKQVLVSAWVKEAQDCHCTTYTGNQLSIVVTQASGSNTVIAKPSGNIIEGWQRIEQVVDVPAGATMISINLQSTSDAVVYFDDLRVHPYNANMKSFVYNPVNLRLMAELDENNYATFYEYDDDGTLVRLKKETERGIKTIKETRSALLKDY